MILKKSTSHIYYKILPVYALCIFLELTYTCPELHLFLIIHS